MTPDPLCLARSFVFSVTSFSNWNERNCARWVVLEPPAGGVPPRPLVGGGTLGQGLFQTVRILETVLRTLGQAAENHAFEIGGYVGLKLRQRRYLVASVGYHHFQRTGAFEGRAAGEQVIGDGAQGV